MKRKLQQGSALVYILVAVALLALLTAVFTDSASQQQSAQNAAKLATEIKSQIDFIRAAVNECVLSYPNGDITMPAAPANVGGIKVTRPYPLNSQSTYLANPTTGWYRSEDIRCPGNPGNSNDHARLFGGNTGRYLPPTPPNTWRSYYNIADGVFLVYGIWKSDAFYQNALERVEQQFAKCEADLIDARTGGTKIIGGPDAQFAICESGNLCLRVWLLRGSTAHYPTEAGCPD